MKKKLFLVFLSFIFFMISTFNVLICHAVMNDIDNGKLRVQYNKVHNLNDEKINEKRDKHYDNIVPLSKAEEQEIEKDAVNVDFSNIDVFDDNFSDCDYFDINGFIYGDWRSTTYEDLGYFGVLKVNDYAPTLMKYNGYVINTIQCDVETEFVHEGNFVKVEYVLKNVGDTDATISLGTFADIQIGDNDCATIERIGDSVGVKMYDESDDLQFTFYGKDMDYVTNIDRLWLGLYPSEEYHFFNQDNINKIEKNDTSFTFSWIDRVIPVGETQRFSILIGIGKLSSIPIIEFDPNQSNYYTKYNVNINTTVRDNDDDSEVEVYYVVDNSENQEKLDFKKLENGKANFEIDLTSKELEIGKHHIKAWARDNQGNMSSIIEKDFYITSLEKPVVDMNEEWTKDSVKFKILDGKNLPESVSKYYYRIDEGEWVETELDKETIALDETGIAKVEAKVVGLKEEDYAISDPKTARVDRAAPKDNKADFSDGKISFSAKDEHSGLKGFWYDMTEESQPKDGIENYTLYVQGAEIPKVDSKEDLYLHFISSDYVDNQAKNKLFLPYPKKVEIEVDKEFKDTTPNFIFTDSQVPGDYPFIYEVQINDGQIGNGEPGNKYDITNPLIGKNTIKVTKKDILGRSSETAVAEFNYTETEKNENPEKSDSENHNSQEKSQENNNDNNNETPSKNQSEIQNQEQNIHSSEQSNQQNNVQPQQSQSGQQSSNNESEPIIQKQTQQETTQQNQNNSQVNNTNNQKNSTALNNGQTSGTTDGTKSYFVESKDDTVANKKIPKAGKKKVVLAMMIVCIFVAGYSLIRYKRSRI